MLGIPPIEDADFEAGRKRAHVHGVTELGLAVADYAKGDHVLAAMRFVFACTWQKIAAAETPEAMHAAIAEGEASAASLREKVSP